MWFRGVVEGDGRHGNHRMVADVWVSHICSLRNCHPSFCFDQPITRIRVHHVHGHHFVPLHRFARRLRDDMIYS